MKAILIFLCSAGLAVAVQGGVIAFDDIGPNGVFTPGGTVVGNNPGPIAAANFIPSVTGTLSTVDFAVAGTPGTVVEVWLYSDKSGAPDPDTAVFLDAVPTTQDQGIVTLPISKMISINSGSSYWLALQVLFARDEQRVPILKTVLWNQVSPAVPGLTAVSPNGKTWDAELSSLPGFRISVDTALPDSGSTILLLGCAVGLILLGPPRHKASPLGALKTGLATPAFRDF